MIREIIEAITDKKNSVDLRTSKSPVPSVTVLKYDRGDYGILNYSMSQEARDFLMDNGFIIDRNTKYPYKNYKTLKDVEKALKDMFGIKKGLVEA